MYMWLKLVICNFLVTFPQGSITSSNNASSVLSSTTTPLDSFPEDDNATTPSSHFDVDNELAKISASCLSSRDYEELAGNIVKHGVARMFGFALVNEGVFSIGLTELRAALKFAPLPPWQPYTSPSEHELASAPTVEAYYDLREPRTPTRSLDSHYLLETNLPPAIAFLDKRFPSIRIIFKRGVAEILRSKTEIDRKEIDRIIKEFLAIRNRIHNATERMFYNNDECWDLVQ